MGHCCEVLSTPVKSFACHGACASCRLAAVRFNGDRTRGGAVIARCNSAALLAKINRCTGNSSEAFWGLAACIDGRLSRWVRGDDTAAHFPQATRGESNVSDATFVIPCIHVMLLVFLRLVCCINIMYLVVQCY